MCLTTVESYYAHLGASHAAELAPRRVDVAEERPPRRLDDRRDATEAADAYSDTPLGRQEDVLREWRQVRAAESARAARPAPRPRPRPRPGAARPESRKTL